MQFYLIGGIQKGNKLGKPKDSNSLEHRNNLEVLGIILVILCKVKSRNTIKGHS